MPTDTSATEIVHQFRCVLKRIEQQNGDYRFVRDERPWTRATIVCEDGLEMRLPWRWALQDLGCVYRVTITKEPTL